MSEEVDRLAALIGEVKGSLQSLAREFETHKDETTKEQRKIHDIIVAMSESTRNIARDVEEMKPLVEDYREKRAEARGAWRFAVALWISIGGIITLAVSKISDWLTYRPH